MKKLSDTTSTTYTEIAVTPALSLDNTLLTLTPASELPENEFVTLEGFTYHATGYLSGSNWYPGEYTESPATYYVYLTGTGSIGSTPSVIVDNFNYCTNGAAVTTGDASADSCATGGIAGTVYMLFPEQVWGTYSIKQKKVGTTVTNSVSNAAYSAITGQGVTDSSTMQYCVKIAKNSSDLQYNNGDGSSSSKPVPGSSYNGDCFRVDTGQSMQDNLDTTPDTLTIAIDAYDVEGNVYQTESTFPVK
jgi:hypothetical protein